MKIEIGNRQQVKDLQYKISEKSQGATEAQQLLETEETGQVERKTADGLDQKQFIQHGEVPDKPRLMVAEE